MESVKPSELVTAARVADALVYAAGIAGIVAGGLLFRDGQAGFAVVAWALAFVAGAALRLAAWGARALAQLLVRAEHLADAVDDLRAQQAAGPRPVAQPDTPDAPVDPYKRWGRWH